MDGFDATTASGSEEPATKPDIVVNSPIRQPESTFTIQEPGQSTPIEQSPDSTTIVDGEAFTYPTGTRLYATLFLLVSVSLSGGLDLGIIAITIPTLTNEFHSLSDIGWYSTALRLVLCSFMFLFSKAYTLFSTRWLMVTSLAFVSTGLLISTFAQTSSMFIVGRAVSGLGQAGMWQGWFAIFVSSFPLARRPFIGGLLGGFETIACTSAPLLGGALIDGWTWRACFGLTVPLHIAGIVITWLYLGQNKQFPAMALPFWEKIGRLDLLGLAAFVPAITCLLVALQWGGSQFGWSDWRILLLLITFATLLAVFGYFQFRGQDNASIPLRLLTNRSLVAGTFFCACANGTLAVTEYYMAIYFQGVRGKSASQAGVFALPMVIGLCVSCILAGSGTSWLGYYVPFMYVTTILGPIAAGLLTTIDLQTSLVKLCVLLALIGVACGAGIQAPQIAAQTVLKEQDVTVGWAIVQFGSQMGPVIFTSASATLFLNRLSADIMEFAPGSNITAIENAGLADIRKAVGADRLEHVLSGYDEAIIQTLYLPVALTCLTIVSTLTMEWRSVKKKPE